MKKLFSFLIFAGLLIWTWTVIHSQASVGFETHSGIQDKMAALIESAVQSKRPQASNIVVKKIWTETLANNKVRAVFSYSYDEPQEDGDSSAQEVEGEAILFRDPSEDPNEDRWVLQSVKTTSDNITFTEGSVIGPDSETQSPETVTPTENAPPTPALTPTAPAPLPAPTPAPAPPAVQTPPSPAPTSEPEPTPTPPPAENSPTE